MKNKQDIQDCLFLSLNKIESYLEKATGKKPTQEELAKALSRYFVLKEIREFIELEREEKKDA